MNFLELISLLLDILLVVAAIVAYLARPRIGGELAKGLRILLAGVMVLGLHAWKPACLFCSAKAVS
jgi:hypothetical protein